MVSDLVSTVTASLPARVDVATAQRIICERYFPITRGTLTRALAELPRVYVGRNALFETGQVLKIAEDLLRRASVRWRLMPQAHSAAGIRCKGLK